MEQAGWEGTATKKEQLMLTREKDKLERTLGGIREMSKVPERGLDRRHQEGTHRRRRGAQAGHPGHRDPRHQLRPGRGRLQDPGQRRRDPLARAADPGRRRRGRRGPGRSRRSRRQCRSRREARAGRLRQRRADGRVGARAAAAGRCRHGRCAASCLRPRPSAAPPPNPDTRRATEKDTRWRTSPPRT